MKGNVTGRAVGGPISDFGLATFTSGDYTPKYRYTTFTDDGKVLKSSTTFIHDDEGKPFGAMCINFDISSLLAFEGALSSLISRNETLDIQENFCPDITGTLNLLLIQALAEMGKPIEMLNVSDRSELIQLLDEMGAFHLKKAVPFVAGKLASPGRQYTTISNKAITPNRCESEQPA